VGVYFLSMSSCTRQVGELAFEQIAVELCVVELEDAGGGDVAEEDHRKVRLDARDRSIMVNGFQAG
jgi:hypothetical protein